MTDDKNKDETGDGDLEGLFDELDEWDAMFDSLHVDDATELANLGPEEPAAAPEPTTVATAPEPGVPDDDEVTNIARPPEPGMSRAGVPVRAPTPQPDVTMVDRAAAPPAEDEAAFADEDDAPTGISDPIALLGFDERPAPRPLAADPADALASDEPTPVPGDLPAPEELFSAADVELDGTPEALGSFLSESTSTAVERNEESGVYTSAVRLAPEESEPGKKGPDTKRRGPAIVSRVELERKRREREQDGFDGGDFDASEATNVISQDELSQMASSAEEFFSEHEPEIQLEVDTDFYDDIEYDEDAAEVATEEEASVSARLPVRRKTAHIVRRETIGPDAIEFDEDAPVVEIEADHSDEVALADIAEVSGSIDTGSALGDLDRELGGASFADEESLESHTVIGVAPPAESAPPVVELEAAGEPELLPAPVDEAEQTPFAPEAPRGLSPSVEVDAELISPVAVPLPILGDDDEAAGEGLAENPFAFSDVEGDVDLAIDALTALDQGSLERPDVAPELPEPVFATAEPELDLSAISIDEVVLPSTEDRTEAWAQQLVWYEKELELADDPGVEAELRLEAGRLAERLGDMEKARGHFDAALGADSGRVAALRALRAVERTLGNWGEVVKLIDSELALAAQRETRALAAYRTELLIAMGEQDLARVAVGELLDDAPTDVRALLANLELAHVDGRDDEFADTLERLAKVLADGGLVASLHLLRARLAEKSGSDPEPAYRASVEAGDQPRAALGGLAGLTLRNGDRAGAAEALATLTRGSVAEQEPAYAAAVEWRRSRLLEDDDEACDAAMDHVAALASADPFLLSLCAERKQASGSHGAAIELYTALAESAPSALDRKQAFEAIARLYAGPLAVPERAAEALRRVIEQDPGDATAAAELFRALEAAGDDEALEELDRAAMEADDSTSIYRRIRIADRYIAAGREDDAIAELEAAAEPGESPAVDEALLGVLRAAGRTSDRMRTLSRIAMADASYSDPVSAHRRKARSAEQVAATAEEPPASEAAMRAAISAWRAVTDIDSDSLSAHISLVRLAERLGEPELLSDVLAAAQPAMPPERTVGLAIRRAQLLEQEGEAAAQVEDLLREAQALSPDDPRVIWALVARLGVDDRWADAAMVLSERAQRLGDSEEAHLLRYRAAQIMFEKTDDVGGAVELLSPVVEAHPEFSAGGDLLQSMRRRMGSASAVPSATRSAGAAQLFGAGDAFARLVREAESIEDSDPKRATDLYTEARQLRKDSPLARDGFVRAASAAGESAPLAELALADLKRAEGSGDTELKARAYEELARIDADLRGDPASALLGWESAVKSDPKRMSSLRALEKAYLSTSRHKDLLGLYQQLIAAVGESPNAVWLALECARLADKLSLPADEVLLNYRRALIRMARCRMALFRLESHERLEGFSEKLAELERNVADYFERDPRARAAFLTRSGETLQAIGELDDALVAFRDAVEVVPGYAPALVGWRDAAVAGERWRDVADAAIGEAASAATDEDRARLSHLAGVALMDKALDGDGAIAVLRNVITIDPSHTDAFARLRVLYDEQGRQEDLAQLIEIRLDSEREPAIKLALHTELAEIHRNFLDDRDTARLHLKKVLEIDPDNLPAISTLSDIAWELGEWADSAEALIARAKLENNSRILKGIFYRLGTIYADHLPDPKWAMKSFQKVLSYDPGDEGALERIANLAMQIGEWKLALGACEQLIKADPPAQDKIRHFHTVARIYLEGFEDSKRAERALRIALDSDPTSDVALRALIDFYKSTGDSTSMRVHLDRVGASMRVRLNKNTADVVAYEVLAKAMHARHQLGVPGSLAIAHCAAEAAVLFGSGDEGLRQLAAEAGRQRPPINRLGEVEIDDMLFPRSAAGALRSLFRHFGDRVSKHVGVDVRRWGVGRGDRVKKGADPAATIIAETAEMMGASGVEIYVSAKNPNVMAVEPTSPISIIVGSELYTPDRPAELRFIAARGVKLAQTWLAVPARMQPDDFGILIAGILRQFKPDFAPPALDESEVAAEQQRLRRLIPSSMMQDLAPFALGIAGADFDHRAIWSSIAEAGNRAGLMAAGSVVAALAVTARVGGYRDIHQAAADPFAASLLRFSVSEDHAYLRAALTG